MRVIAFSLFTNMKLFFGILIGYVSTLGVIQLFLLDNPYAILPSNLVFTVTFLLLYIMSKFESFTKLYWASKLLILMYFMMIVYILMAFIAVVYIIYWYDRVKLTIISAIILAVYYFIISLLLLSSFETFPLFRSDFTVDEGVDYPITGPWLIYGGISTFIVSIIGFVPRGEIRDGATSGIVFLLIMLPILLVANEVVWLPKNGLAYPKTRSYRVKHKNKSLSDPISVINAFRSGEIEYLEHIDYLYNMRTQIFEERSEMRKFFIVNHIVDSARFEGEKGREAIPLIFMTIPLLLERWRVFALLPKHLQRLAYKFFELLYLLDLMDDRWHAIMEHEVGKRVSSKYRFALYWNSPIKPGRTHGEWYLSWDHQYFIGEKGFEKAKEKLFEIRRRGIKYIPKKRFEEAWLDDLENSTLQVFSTFFGVGSRSAWGGSVNKGSYALHRFVVAGNRIENYESYLKEKKKKVKQAVAVQSTSIEKREDLDIDYIESYFEKGFFPPLKESKERTKEDVLNKIKSMLQKSKNDIYFFAGILFLSVFLRQYTSFYLLSIFIYVFFVATPKKRSYVQEEDPFGLGGTAVRNEWDTRLGDEEPYLANFRVLFLGAISFLFIYLNSAVK